MVHPCDGEAWQQFDKGCKDPEMSFLCIASDGLTPFNFNIAPHSCRLVFVSPLNLPPGTMLKSEYIFVRLLIPDREHIGKKLNIPI
jgi:hypothetical protein